MFQISFFFLQGQLFFALTEHDLEFGVALSRVMPLKKTKTEHNYRTSAHAC